MTFHVPNKFRITTGHRGSTPAFGNNGAFSVQLNYGQKVSVIASDGASWEHVSVSRHDRCPTWEEMCQVKALFWSGEDVVIQYHPADAQYVNNHNYCLHLWRPIGIEIPQPPAILVGFRSAA